MRFDWERFCTQRQIPFEREGPRVSKGNINVRCPFCGTADRSGHMGLSTDKRNPVWGCLRNAQHRGRDPAKLIARLLNVGYSVALAMADGQGVPLDEFEEAIERLKQRPEADVKPAVPKELVLPKECKSLANGVTYKRDVFMAYLQRRGFPLDVVDHYALYYALTGPQAWRVVFEVRDAGWGLIGWTGRGVRRGTQPRYLTSQNLPNDALLAFRHDYEQLPVTVVCEGPMDALKVDYYGREFGVQAVATMGTGAAGLTKAAALRERFANLAVLFDADADAQALAFAEELGARVFFLPRGVEDPGELNRETARRVLQQVADKLLPV